MKSMKKLISGAAAAVMLVTANILPASAGRYDEYVRGDVNNDGVVNTKDYIDLYNYYYGDDVPGVTYESANINRDFLINKKDVISLREQVRMGIGFIQRSKYEYTLMYNGMSFNVIYTPATSSYKQEKWKIENSYRIKSHEARVYICQMLQEHHLLHNADGNAIRSAENMAFEWRVHNDLYEIGVAIKKKNPAKSQYLIAHCKDVDMNPEDSVLEDRLKDNYDKFIEE
ncbi:MAG: hypothetical protein IKR76_05550 [Ruminococcus sp.]|nr:hypothetical protein [Ruminococcus sp.]